MREGVDFEVFPDPYSADVVSTEKGRHGHLCIPPKVLVLTQSPPATTLAIHSILLHPHLIFSLLILSEASLLNK